MLSHPRSPEDVAKTGPAGSSAVSPAGSPRRDWRRIAAGVVLGAGVTAGAATSGNPNDPNAPIPKFAPYAAKPMPAKTEPGKKAPGKAIPGKSDKATGKP